MTFDMYREIIIDHYRHPRNFGRVKQPTASAEKRNTLCGDEIKISVRTDKKGKIGEIKFEGAGCSISRAGGSILTEKVKGKTLAELKKYSDQNFIKDMGVPIMPARKRCALLALEALRQALKIK